LFWNLLDSFFPSKTRVYEMAKVFSTIMLILLVYHYETFSLTWPESVQNVLEQKKVFT